MLCYYCEKRQATHFCDQCKHWICSNPICLMQSGLSVLGKQVDKLLEKVDGVKDKS